MNDLEQRIQKKRSFERVFIPDKKSVEEIARQFAHFYAIAVTDGGDVHKAVDTMVRELANNSLYAHGEEATMKLHIGPKGVIVSYSDTGGFYQQRGILDVLAEHFAGNGGLARISSATDEVNFEAMHAVFSCVKYGSLTLRETREYALAGQPIGAKV